MSNTTMTKHAISRPIVQPVLDRLIDMDRNEREDPPVTHAQSVRQLKATLQRDLEWLLNTRRIAYELPEGAEELRHSLYYFGLPEFAGLSMTSFQDQSRVLKDIEAAVSTFENRLTSIRVSMRPVEGTERAVHFVIEAILLIDPIPERVAFDTVLELTNGEYRVRGNSGA
jgi:type VI secretion system protein ImpF